jgi:hypothetical protein
MSKNDIVKIELLKNVRIKNMGNGFVFPKQNVMRIYFRNGQMRELDLFSNRDFTDVGYFTTTDVEKAKIKVLFEEIDD